MHLSIVPHEAMVTAKLQRACSMLQVRVAAVARLQCACGSIFMVDGPLVQKA